MSDIELKTVEQVTRPRHAPGVNWGQDILVLARYGKKELWWVRGANAQKHDYIPAYLLYVADAEQHYRGDHSSFQTDIFEGGRLSRKRLNMHAATIDTYFGVTGLGVVLDPKKTILVEDEHARPEPEPQAPPDWMAVAMNNLAANASLSLWDKILQDIFKNPMPYTRETRAKWHEVGNAIEAKFHDEAIEAVGMKNHPKADKAYAMAWERGHSSGYGDVLHALQDLAELLLDK